MKYRLVAAEKVGITVARARLILGVGASGYITSHFRGPSQ